MSDYERQSSVGPRLRGQFRYGDSSPADGSVEAVGVELPSDGIEFFLTVCETSFDATPYGPHRASIHLLGDATVVYVPEDAGGGVIATFDPTSDRTQVGTLLARVREAGR